MSGYFDRFGDPMPEDWWDKSKFGTRFSRWQTDRRVGNTVVGDVAVSTVWLGLDHNYSNVGAPLIFETMGRWKIEVTDRQALLEWVKREHPTEVVESVNPAYMKSFTPQHGVVLDALGTVVPGVDVVQGDPYVSVRKADGAEDVIAELFRSGSVGLDGIKAAALPPVVDAAHLDSMPVNRWTEAGAIGGTP